MSELGTREHYEEYVQNCNDAGIIPESWTLWQIRYPQPVVASEHAATVERLEDLAPSHIEILKQLASGYRKMLDIRVWEYLFDRGLVDITEDGIDILTPKGSALVADYQRRQGEEAAENFAHESMMETELVDVEEEITHLQAEVARLEAENAALKEALKPFAKLASFDGWNTSAISGKDAVVYSNDNGKLTRGDFDAALEASK